MRQYDQQKESAPNEASPAQKSNSNGVPKPLQELEESSLVQKTEDSSIVQKGVKPARAFFQKFSNDWVTNLQAGALAYNLLLAFFPIIVALLAIFGLVFGGLGKTAQDSLIQGIQHALPSQQGVSQALIQQSLTKLASVSGPLGIIALLIAIFGGSRLFITIENCFDLIFHQVPRTFLRQNIMAISMLLLFIVLIPIMAIAASGPALVTSLLQKTPLNNIPGIGFVFGLGGVLGSMLVTWILFEAIYIVVPNQRISFRNSWRGAVFAAIALQLYLALFPLYATHFLGGYLGQIGFALILIVFFYYFAVILLIGAEFNAFFAEGIQETPGNLAVVIHNATSHDKPVDQKERQAPPDHKPDEQDQTKRA